MSFLCVLGKVLEKNVHSQVTNFLEENRLFTELQSGFRQGRSTVTALVKVVDDFRASMDNRSMNLLVLPDLSKAFDCVHYDLHACKTRVSKFL